MVILLTGATGFIGSRLAAALRVAGHAVISATRSPLAPGEAGPELHVDFAKDVEPAVWAPRLAGVDVVINSVGLLQESGSQTFEALHAAAPIALFEACASAGVRRVVQISALGADDAAQSAYHLSKRAADEALARLPIDWVIVQPSLVYGRGGASAALFDSLAAAPLIPLPGRGRQQVQPVHVDDVVDGIVALLERPDVRAVTVPFVGPEALTLRAFLGALRKALGFGRALFVPVPTPLVRLAARVGVGLLSTETLQMLERGNVADAAPLQRLLCRRARSVEEFVSRADRASAAREALLHVFLPGLRVGVAVMWLVAGIVSLGLYPVEESLRRIAVAGITAQPAASVVLYGAALLDLALGVATLVMRRRQWLWLAQIALVLVYTAIVSIRMPELWLEPFGPIAKNVPVLALLWFMYALDGRRWNT